MPSCNNLRWGLWGGIKMGPILDVEPKIGGFSPKSSHFNRVFHYFHHPFWGTPIFGHTHLFGASIQSMANRWSFWRSSPVPRKKGAFFLGWCHIMNPGLGWEGWCEARCGARPWYGGQEMLGRMVMWRWKKGCWEAILIFVDFNGFCLKDTQDI